MSTPHPLSGSSLTNLVKLLRRHGTRIERRHLPRLLRIGAAVTAATPLRLLESSLHSRAIAKQGIQHPPIMVLGHWRSGTTNMQNLLLCDDRFASVSLLHCSIPHLHLTFGGPISRFISRRLPKIRPMDRVRLGIHEPMSEDFGLVGCSDQTHYSSYFFPQQAEEEFRRTVLLETADRESVTKWEHHYLRLLKRVTYEAGGKQLCLKNPPNTARVPHVLRLFPDAKFIFVRRNPYVVHASTCRLMDRFLKSFAFQSWDGAEVESFVSRRYELLMDRWFADRGLIPGKNLIEIAHEDVVRDPVGCVERIYNQLGLDGFGSMQPKLVEYVESQRGYQNNEYVFDRAYIDRIDPHVRRTVERWCYELPTTKAA